MAFQPNLMSIDMFIPQLKFGLAWLHLSPKDMPPYLSHNVQDHVDFPKVIEVTSRSNINKNNNVIGEIKYAGFSV